MTNYESWTVSEMEQEAYRIENNLALAFVGKIKEIEESLACIKHMEDSVEVLKEIEYIKRILNLENSW